MSNIAEKRNVLELTAALSASSVRAKEGAERSGVQQHEELCEVLANLDIVPGSACAQGGHRLDPGLGWADRAGRDHRNSAVGRADEMTERLQNAFVKDVDPSDDEVYFTDTVCGEGSTAGVKRGGATPPSYAELSSYFSPLEKYAGACGNDEAGNSMRKARMSFLGADAA